MPTVAKAWLTMVRIAVWTIAIGAPAGTAASTVLAETAPTAAPDSARFTTELAQSPLAADLSDRFGWQVRDVLPASPTLDDYVGYALVHSPAVAAAYADWRATAERETQVSALPEPRLSWGEMIVPVQTRTGPQQRVFSLSQTLPWFGKLSLRGKIAGERAAGAQARLAGVLLDVQFAVCRAYYDLAYLGAAAGITERHLTLIAQWEAAARARYAAGAGGLADLLKAQVEYAKLEERRVELTDGGRPVAAELNAALGRSTATPVPWPALQPADAVALAEDSLLTAALQRQPELLALRHAEQGEAFAGQLAGRQKYPDLTLGIDYIVTGEATMPGIDDSGQDPVVARLAVDLPIWWGKYRAAEREAESRRRALAAARHDVGVDLAAQIERSRFEYREAVRTAELYGGPLLEKGRQALAAATAAYQSDLADFLAVVDAQQTLLALELTAARAHADRLISLAQLERLIAGPAPLAAPVGFE